MRGGAGSVRCSLLLLVRPAEEMCGEEAVPPTGRRREVSGEEDATDGEMCLAEGVEWRITAVPHYEELLPYNNTSHTYLSHETLLDGRWRLSLLPSCPSW